MPISIRPGSVPVSDPTVTVPYPGVPAAQIRGLSAMTWFGVDGSVWDLLRPAAGVFLMPGVTGLYPEAYQPWTVKSGGHGQFFRGGRFEAREVLWPTHLYHDGTSVEFTARFAAWWDSFSYTQPGVWEVADAGGVKRRAGLRLVSSGEVSERDPVMRGWISTATRLVMDSPFWEGDPVTLSWGPASAGDGNFLKPAHGVIRIAGGYTVAQAKATNPGDTDMWPVWTVTGPWTTARLGLGGRVIQVPFAGTASDTLVVDTHRATAVMNGVDRTGDLDSWAWAPIPPGKSVPLDLQLAGNGRVQMTATPLYLRAFG